VAEFHRANQEPVNAFRLDDHYLFRHYFEADEIFARLRTYYHNSQYRFEVPVAEFEEIKSFLADYGYGFVAVHETVEFVVVVRRYTEHPGNIFKQSVIQRSILKYNCFPMTSGSAVEDAIKKTASAKSLPETGIDNPF
jgi:hypothetical protein